MSTPACDARCSHYGRKLQFGFLIASGTDGGHNLAALFLCENIGHRNKVSDFGLSAMPCSLIAQSNAAAFSGLPHPSASATNSAA